MRRFPALTHKEFNVFKKLNSPSKIQDFLEKIPINFRNTYRSPLLALKLNEAHCLEGAFLGAAALWHNGMKPLLLDLKTDGYDEDHVVAIFKKSGYWGALTKTNHAVLRYRDPVYKTVRELAMSYFNEYFLDDGEKTLRGYSAPFDLLKFGDRWLTSKKSLWRISKALDDSPHFKMAPNIASRLRPADPIEIKAGKLVRWRKRR